MGTTDQRGIKTKMDDHQTITGNKIGTTTSGRKIIEDHLTKNVRTTAPRRNKIHPRFRKRNPQLQTLELALRQLLRLVSVHAQLKYSQFVLMDVQTQSLLAVKAKSNRKKYC